VPIIAEYHALLTTNAIFVRRTAGIGIISPEMAIDFGCTGPVLRGSGVDQDLRRDGEVWYTRMYDGYAFEVIVEKDGHYPKDHNYPAVPQSAVLGDCWHRFYVRMLEVMQSIDLVRQAIDRYSRAKGSHGEPIKLAEKLPKGKPISKPKPPRGRWVSTSSAKGAPSPGASVPAAARSRTSASAPNSAAAA
jgi:NADH-quinone oxidoreductase subunit D